MKFVENVRGMVHVTRFPATTRQSVITTTSWAVALAFAVVSITAYVVLGNYTSPFLYGVVLLAALEIYMLANAVQGVLFRRQVGRLTRQWIEASHRD